MSIFQMLFSPSGRIRRIDWWVAILSLSIVSAGVKLVGYQLISGESLESLDVAFDGWLTLQQTPQTLFVLAVTALSAWPLVCLTAKRWHDRNRTGWFAGLIVLPNLSFNSVTALLWLAVLIWQLVELGFVDGTKGPNRFGPSPKDIETAPDVF